MTRTRTLLALAACLTLPVLGAGQGLGGASAKEKQRRTRDEKKAKPAKTYTQDEVLSLPPVENPGAASDSGAATSTFQSSSGSAPGSAPRRSTRGTAASGDSEGNARARDEGRWRERANAARERIDKARRMVEFWEGLHLVPGYRYVDRSGQPVAGSVAELQGKTAAAKAELAAAEKALENLQDEARRASIPPGWLR